MGSYLWLPLGVGFYVFSVMKCYYDRPEKVSEGNYYLAIVVMFPITLYITSLIITAGIPALVNRIVGESFQFQTTVTGKYWGLKIFHGRLHVANYEPRSGFLWVSESLWNEVRKGDTVTISGVRSVLGQSINGVEKTKTEEAPIEPKTPKLRWGPQTQESPPDPETPKFRWGK
jgi:hypothetical protein